MMTLLPAALMVGCSSTSSPSGSGGLSGGATATATSSIAPVGPTALGLGAASTNNFAVFASSGITNDAENICGNMGLYPAAASNSTGAYSFTCSGNVAYLKDATGYAQACQTAIFAATTGAYNVALAETNPILISSVLGTGQSLAPGLYAPTSSGTFSLAGTLTLNNAGGNPNNAYIFMTGTTGTPGTSITTAANSSIVLVNVKAANVFWIAGTSLELGAATSFAGNILASTTVLFDAGSTLEGRAFSGTAITFFGSNAITNP
jgi:hypothetical protein